MPPYYEDFKRLEWSAEDRHRITEVIKNSQKYQELAVKLELVVREAYPKLDIDNVKVGLLRAFTPPIERMIKLSASEELLDDHLTAFIQI